MLYRLSIRLAHGRLSALAEILVDSRIGVYFSEIFTALSYPSRRLILVHVNTFSVPSHLLRMRPGGCVASEIYRE